MTVFILVWFTHFDGLFKKICWYIMECVWQLEYIVIYLHIVLDFFFYCHCSNL